MPNVARGLVLVACIVFLPASAPGADTVRASDGLTILVNKDVNGERWAITYDGLRGRVTGNVSVAGGVVFVECPITGDDGVTLDLACRSLPPTGPEISVSLPASFFGLVAGACPNLDSIGSAGVWTVAMSDDCGNLFAAEAEFDQVACETSGFTEYSDDPRFQGALVSTQVYRGGRLRVRVDLNGLCAGSLAGDLKVDRHDDYLNAFQYSGALSGHHACCATPGARLLLSIGYY